MPQPVSTVRSTAKTRAVLAVSLAGWLILCGYVWILLGNSDGASIELTGLDSVEVSTSDARPEPDETRFVDDDTFSEAIDPPSAPTLDVDADPESISTPQVSTSPEASTSPEGDGTPEAIANADATATPEADPTPDIIGDSAAAEQSAPSSVIEQGGETDISTTPIDKVTALLEGFPDPEGLGEAGGDDVVIPLAPESAETSYERQRQEELAVLSGLSSRLRFESGSAERTARVQTVLDRIFDPLFLYADTNIEITVNSNDLASPADNRQLSRLRGRVIVDYLAQRGLETDRFVVVSEGGRGLAIGAHRVQVVSEVLP